MEKVPLFHPVCCIFSPLSEKVRTKGNSSLYLASFLCSLPFPGSSQVSSLPVPPLRRPEFPLVTLGSVHRTLSSLTPFGARSSSLLVGFAFQVGLRPTSCNLFPFVWLLRVEAGRSTLWNLEAGASFVARLHPPGHFT